MAGVVGFEPTHGDTKNRCLTTWLHPNLGFIYLKRGDGPTLWPDFWLGFMPRPSSPRTAQHVLTNRAITPSSTPI